MRTGERRLGRRIPEAQRLCRDHDGARRHRLLVGLEALHALLGCAVEPDLRDENREQAEQHGKPDHDDGACAHEKSLELAPSLERSCRMQYRGRVVLNW